MINRPGLTGMVKNLTPSPSPQSPKKNSNSSIVGRVVDIILDENHPKYKEMGLGTSAIGIIFIENVGRDNIGISKPVKPYFPNIKNYPLVNEFVYCFYLPSPTLSSDSDLKRDYYYLPNFGLWYTPHFNALPPALRTLQNPLSRQGYQQVETGAQNIQTDTPLSLSPNSPTNPSQNTFVEKSNIHPLMPFEGDIIYEGRFGNSLRFGSTAKSLSQYKNNWSETGDNGDPIMILRNGQPKKSPPDGWIPITENINEDLSSIYLTSNQKIPINDTGWNFTSYVTPPEHPSQFISPQIFLSSDRIVISSKEDSILLRSKNSISLSSVKSVNIDSPSTIIQSSNVFLGDKGATESGVKGDTLYNKLDIILTSLITLISVLEVQQIWPGGIPSPDGGSMLISSTTKQQLTEAKNSLKEILSNVVKTI